MLSKGHNEISAFHCQPCFSSGAGCQLTEGRDECQRRECVAAGRAESRSRQQAGTPPLSGSSRMFSLLKLPPGSSHCDPTLHIFSRLGITLSKDCHNQGESSEQGHRACEDGEEPHRAWQVHSGGTYSPGRCLRKGRGEDSSSQSDGSLWGVISASSGRDLPSHSLEHISMSSFP